MTRTFRYVTNQVVKEILDAESANLIAEQTLVSMADDQVRWSVPRQLDVPFPDAATHFKVKGCHLVDRGVVGFRVIGLNRTTQGASVMAERPTKHVLLYDAQSAALFAIVDERWSYAMRTGACGAVALRHLRSADATHLAIIGTGHMAYSAAVTTAAAIPLSRITIWSRGADNRERFAARLSEELGIEVRTADTAQDCVRDAPMVVTATNAREPFLTSQDFAPGCTIYAMGGFQEVDDETYQSFEFYVDDREQVKVLEDIQDLIERRGYTDAWVRADLAEVVSGKHPGRVSQDERILIRSQGLTAQDVVQSLWIAEQVEKRDGGTRLEDVLAERPGDSLY